MTEAKEGEMEAEDISRAVAELHEAEEEFQLAKGELSEARSKETSAINRLNKAQKCLDNMIKELKAASPQESDWHRRESPHDREDICGGCGLPLAVHYKGERCPSK